MEDSENKVKKIKEALAKHVKDGEIINPGGSLEIAAAMSGDSVDSILKKFTEAALEGAPVDYERNHAFWHGLQKGIGYVMVLLQNEDGKKLDELGLADKLYLATGIEACEMNINKLKS